jgi:hypothetical protein
VLIVALVLVAAALVPLTGGRLGRLAQARFSRAWALPVSLAIQILVISIWPSGPERVLQVLHLVSYAFAGLFLVANRRVPGIALVVLGGVLNVAAITANDGVMPASEAAYRTAGLELTGEFENSAPVEDPRLAVLGDVFAVPEGWPLANVFSIGDVAIVLGAAVMVHALARRPVPSEVAATAEGPA